MAEKRVGSKRKPTAKTTADTTGKKQHKSTEDAEYEAFWDQYGAQLRKRSTQNIAAEPKKENRRQQKDIDTSRSGEIDPYTTVNPAADHQIFTKRSGRVLADDTGFKAYSYHQRFELKPKMPELNEADEQEDLTELDMPGQQTMAELVSAVSSDESMAVPLEGKIENDDDPFAAAYKLIKESGSATFGKGEKLRAIARTAADDNISDTESQITFPAFDPLFVFPEEKNGKKKTAGGKGRRDKKKKHIQDEKPFDIEEKDIVTGHTAEEAAAEAAEPSIAARNERKAKNRFFEILNDSGEQDSNPLPFEINRKSDVKPTLSKLKKIRLREIAKTAAIALFGIILLIISAVFGKDSAPISAITYANLNLLFLIPPLLICAKELLSGLKDLIRAKASPHSAAALIVLIAAVQILVSYFLSDTALRLIVPAAIFSLINLTLPKIFLTNNTQAAVAAFTGSNTVSVLKNVSESGIEGSLKNTYAPKSGSVRYSASTWFASDLIKKLTNAVPKPFGGKASYIFFTLFAVITGVVTAVLDKNMAEGLTVMLGLLIVCLPTAHTAVAALLLLKTNKKLTNDNASLLTYRSAAELTDTKALIFDASEIIDMESCSIHGIKTFGRTDPKKATMFCASLITAGKSPLEAIIRHATEDSGEEIREPEEILIRHREGIAGLVDGNKILLGTKDFLTANNIFIPDEDYEEKYITGDRKLLFLSVNGEFCMLLIVSYHIKRSVSVFLKYLSQKGIKPIIYSSDPNITAPYIEKKCRLKKGTTEELTSVEASYFRDALAKTQKNVPADTFTDGKLTSMARLFKGAFALTAVQEMLPLILYAVSVLSAVILTIPIFTGSVHMINNFYIILIKLTGFALSALLASLYAKRNQ